MTSQTLLYIQWFFLIYFSALNAIHLLLNLLGISSANRYVPESVLDNVSRVYYSYEPPVSLLVPSQNQRDRLIAFIHTLFMLDYPEFEIVVVENGSRDGTLEALIREFSLVEFPEAYRVRLPTQPVRAIYTSPNYPNLRVLDKEASGRADALNAGINASRYPLVCSMDVDFILQRQSLRRAVRPFIENPLTVASGGIARISNGSVVSDGLLEELHPPRGIWSKIQSIQSLEAFFLGRLGWMPLNPALMGTGSLGIYRKEAVVDAGGYRTNSVGEDASLIARLHRTLRARRRKYRITFVPEPIYWVNTEGKWGPDQVIRWQQALGKSIGSGIGLLFNPKAGALGFFKMPYLVLFAWLEPIVEIAGYIFMTWGCWGGHFVPLENWVIFLALAIGYGLQNSITALLIEEILHHPYEKTGPVLGLIFAAIVENLGPRQVQLLFRLLGYVGGGRSSGPSIPSPAPAKP